MLDRDESMSLQNIAVFATAFSFDSGAAVHVTAVSASDTELSGLGDSIEKSRVLSLGLLKVFNQNLSRVGHNQEKQNYSF